LAIAARISATLRQTLRPPARSSRSRIEAIAVVEAWASASPSSGGSCTV
jgi:hypothetical protein